MLIRARLLLALLIPLLAAAPAAARPHTVIRKVGVFPGDMATGLGALWVNDHRGDSLLRISPAGKVTKVAIDESVCSFPAIGGGHVWVWGCDSNETFEVDPKKMQIVAQRKGNAPVFGAGSLWTMDDDGKILRVDPKSGVVLATIDPHTDDANGGPDGVWDGSLWVSGDSSVSRIDIATNKVTAVIPLPGAKPSGDQDNGYLGANYGVFADGEVWLDNVGGVYVVDPATNAVHRTTIRLSAMSQFGDVPIIAGAGSVWVRTGNRRVVRIDPGSEKVIATYPASGGGGGIDVAFHSLWVVNAELGTVWRFPVAFRKPTPLEHHPPSATPAPAVAVRPARHGRTARPSSNGASGWAVGVVGALVLLAIAAAGVAVRRRRAAVAG
jgi:hypothetical protein